MSTKDQILQQLQQSSAMTNARSLVESINGNCYEKCVPRPGDSLSSSEQKCFTACMEKYMAAWNTVSKSYVHRLQQESQQRNALGMLGKLE